MVCDVERRGEVSRRGRRGARPFCTYEIMTCLHTFSAYSCTRTAERISRSAFGYRLGSRSVRRRRTPRAPRARWRPSRPPRRRLSRRRARLERASPPPPPPPPPRRSPNPARSPSVGIAHLLPPRPPPPGPSAATPPPPDPGSTSTSGVLHRSRSSVPASSSLISALSLFFAWKLPSALALFRNPCSFCRRARVSSGMWSIIRLCKCWSPRTAHRIKTPSLMNSPNLASSWSVNRALLRVVPYKAKSGWSGKASGGVERRRRRG